LALQEPYLGPGLPRSGSSADVDDGLTDHSLTRTAGAHGGARGSQGGRQVKHPTRWRDVEGKGGEGQDMWGFVVVVGRRR
jgi:hypothetical protein